MTGAGMATSARLRVLVVDDDANNRDVLGQELDLLDCDPISAADGNAALDRLNEEAVDLVLLDVMMPGLDGFEVLRRMKVEPVFRHLPVIMISARDDLDSVIRCIELGAEDYLPKPFDPTLLRARVGACREKKGWRDQEAAYLHRIEQQLIEIQLERQWADRLLHVILPAPAVAELRATGSIIPRRHEAVAVLFADIVGFTGYCEGHPPEEVVRNLDGLVANCEHLIDAHGLEKIKTVGDGLIATGNLLKAHDDPVTASVRCALSIADAAWQNPAQWRIRAGLHVGPVVAGTVGRSTFSFDIWGDTVNVAARLSAYGDAGGIHLSEAAWRSLSCRFASQRLGPVLLKGKGEVEIYRCDTPARSRP
jgi:class 3 adenylate cyclase